jgi:hypothetical protein
MKLTPEYAQRLFDTGAFVIFSDLPAGAEVGIDGEYVNEIPLITIVGTDHCRTICLAYPVST